MVNWQAQNGATVSNEIKRLKDLVDELTNLLKDRPYIGGTEGHEWNQKVNAALEKD